MTSEKINHTGVTEFLILGFQVGPTIRIPMFILLLVVYCITVFMNLLIIILVSTSKILHTPMYFFISQLSISDLLLTTDIVSKTLDVILNRGTIAFSDCMTQLYFFGSSEASECLLLTVMSYDRYVAICNPLRYPSIMTPRFCMILTIASWLGGFCIVLLLIVTIATLNFCGPNIIDHFFCDFLPILELSCSDPSIVQMEISFFCVLLILVPVAIIIFSYTKIIVTILKIPSDTGRQKAFSTCSSHLIVVSIFYWTLFGVYALPKRGKTVRISKILSLLYTVFTPLINPIIYSLKNNDIKKAIHDLVYKHLG